MSRYCKGARDFSDRIEPVFNERFRFSAHDWMAGHEVRIVEGCILPLSAEAFASTQASRVLHYHARRQGVHTPERDLSHNIGLSSRNLAAVCEGETLGNESRRQRRKQRSQKRAAVHTFQFMRSVR